jgi:acyl-CoA thioesterase II
VSVGAAPATGWRRPGREGHDPPVDFLTMMRLEPHGPDVYVGVGPRYPWGGLYGGQIVAQGLRAAAETVEPEYRVHSLHAYFIRRGDQDEPIRFEVDRSRNGRSFVTRRVVARQATGEILNMACSFQRDEPGPDVQIARLPDVPGAEELAGESWSPMFERRFAIDRGDAEGRSAAWLRMTQAVGDDPVLRPARSRTSPTTCPPMPWWPCTPTGRSPASPRTPSRDAFMSASLDHAIWFHRPPVADRWHLHDLTSHGYLSSRGLSIGHVLTEDGVHVATVAQEVLLRTTKR